MCRLSEEHRVASTSYAERQNLTMRMQMRRFTRLTNAFSKKFENHMHMVALYTVWYNCVKRHKSLKGLSPAMATGLSDTLWSMTDLANRWHYLARIWQTPLLGELFMATTTKAGMRLLLRHGNPRGLPSDYLDHVFQTFDRGTRRAVLKLYRNTRKTDDAARQLMTALRPLDLPALIVWGAHDPYIRVEFAERQREVFPRAEIKILHGSGHWPFADDPESVAQAVLPFLRRQMLPKSTPS
jgi:pimeloyl-ACP methyl ester carboxylesterase